MTDRIRNIQNQFGDDFVQCPKCGNGCIHTPGEIEDVNTLIDDSGNYYTNETIEHRQK